MLHLDAGARQARWRGQPLDLTARAFDLLALLASQPGQVFSAQELTRTLWPQQRVNDSNLRLQVAALRRHLGNDAVQNLPGRGYRLALPARQASQQLRRLPPAAPEPLLGRHQDIARLHALIDQHRLVAVQGAGGIGKTRLAQAVALQRQPQLAGGAAWVDLAQLSAGPDAAADLLRAIALAAGLQAQGLDGPDAGHRLGNAFASLGDCLLLLDNAEHLVDTLCPLLRQLLQGAPQLQVLVTSQRALPMPDAWAYWLEGLAVPAATADAEAAAASPAVQLLLQRARAARQHYQPSTADMALAVALVRTLDGIPLAIELAAAWLPLLGMAELSRLLHDRLNLLRAPAPGPDHRHQTLRTLLDWSCARLPDTARLALLRLSVFAAPFHSATAAQVVAGPGLDGLAALGAIQTLLDHSLLQMQADTDPAAPPRLRLLETTRLYAAEGLQRAGADEQQAAEARHVAAMARLAEQACADFYTASDAAWTARWLPDVEDVMAAFDRAHAAGNADAAAPLIEVLVLGANITGHLQPALARWQATRNLADKAPVRARARLIGWGSLAGGSDLTRQQQAARRVQAWRDAVADDPGAVSGLALALAMQAVVCEEMGDRQAADAALAACEALEHPLWPARLRRRCSWLPLTRMAVHRNDPALYARALPLSRALVGELTQLGARRETTLVQGQLALMLRLQGQPREAVSVLEQAAATQVAIGCDLDAGRSHAFACAAWLEHAAADPQAGSALAEAARAARQALRLQAAHPTDIHHFIEALAWLACRLDDPVAAALLQASGAELRRTLQVAPNALDARLAAQVRAHIDQVPEPLHSTCARLATLPWPVASPGAAPDARVQAETLRQWALNWLAARG